MKNKDLEIACFNLESAIIAQQYGADRVEMCDNMQEGGTTPNFENAQKVFQAGATKLPVSTKFIYK